MKSIVVLWGEKFLRKYVKYVYPCHQVLHGKGYKLYTTSKDWALFNQLVPGHKVSFENIDFFFKNAYFNPYPGDPIGRAKMFLQWRRIMNFALVKEYDLGEIIFNLPPDTIYSSETLANAIIRINNPKTKAVTIHEIRVDEQDFLSRYSTKLLVSDFIRLTLDCMHESYKDHIVTSRTFKKWPTIFYFPLDGETGFICRSFDMHPLAIRCDKRVPYFSQAIDFDLIKEEKGIYRCGDAREMFGAALTPTEDYKPDKEIFRVKPEWVAKIMRHSDFCTDVRKKNFCHSIKFIPEGGSTLARVEAEKEARKFSKAVLKEYDT